MNLVNQVVLVLGLGESGLAMARWCAHEGARLRVADTRAAPPAMAALRSHLPEAELVCGEFNEALLVGVDLVALSPGLAPHGAPQSALIASARSRGLAVVGEIELFAMKLAQLRLERDYAPRVVAITGTNGKTTVTSLVGRMCRRAGLSTLVAGNISPAALNALREALTGNALPEVWVLELSSFQLATTSSLVIDAATILNITEDHLDWHEDMADYAAAKARIFAHAATRILNRGDRRVMEHQAAPPGVRVMSFGLDEPLAADSFGLVEQGGASWLACSLAVEAADGGRRGRPAVPQALTLTRLMPRDALRIRGTHNTANALAALALCQAIGVPLAPALHALRTYEGEAHRVELVASIDGVEYFDDSKGTNVGATVAALEGLGRRLVLIAGGDGKGQDFAPLRKPVEQHASAVLLIGKDAQAIRSALGQSTAGCEIEFCASLEAAVVRAAQLAAPGQAVLLSPACASLDMFRNYAHRAQVFVDAVNQLREQAGAAC